MLNGIFILVKGLTDYAFIVNIYAKNLKPSSYIPLICKASNKYC
jgi:hypothetical protein